MAQQTLPKSMKALVIQGKGSAVIQEIPVPSIEDDEVLVRNVAVAQNPTDWKFIDYVGNPGTICGCDWSGHVVQIGKSVKTLAVGDHIAGFTQGGTYTDRGAYAEYLKVPADLAWKVPHDTFTHEEAATLGCGFWTAVQALFHPTRLGLTEPPEKVASEEWVLIHGASSSVGQFAVQLAHLAGYKVVGLASSKNFDLVKSLGADAVVDYRDPDAVPKIKEVTHDSVHRGFDAISESSTQSLSVKAFAPGPGKLILTLGENDEAQKIRPDVKIQPTLIYSSLGRAYTFGTQHRAASPEDREQMAAFLKKVPELVSSGAIKPNPIKLWGGGLTSINDGLQFMKEGKLSGEKIVYRV